MKTLYIFATSERPDPYINAFAYASQFLEVDTVFLVVISEHDYAEELQESTLLSTAVVANISNQLRALTEGEYIKFGQTFGENSTQKLLNTSNVEIYKECLNKLNKSGMSGIAIPVSDLDNILRSYVRRGPCVFDVSALKKNLLVDVVATLLSIGFAEVYSFELKKRPTFGPDDLYHNLKPNVDFVFRNLIRSAPVKKSIDRITRWSIRSKTVFIFTAILAAIFIPLSIFSKRDLILSIFNVASMAASIGAYVYMLVQDKREF